MRRLLITLTVSCAALVLAPAAQASIASVFTEAIPGATGPATPVSCSVLTGQDDGVRFCGSTSPRSTVQTFDDVPIDVNVAFPAEPETGPDGNFPTVMLFHGYAGTNPGIGSMRRWLDQGYAVFSMTTRGFGESCGSQASRTAAAAPATPATCASWTPAPRSGMLRS